MSVIQLLDGSQAFILNPKDLIDIAYDKLGSEYSDKIEQMVVMQNENELYAEMRIDTDLNSYEGQIEEYRDCMLEVQQIAEEIETYIHECKRFDKKKALEKIELIIRKINNELWTIYNHGYNVTRWDQIL